MFMWSKSQGEMMVIRCICASLALAWVGFARENTLFVDIAYAAWVALGIAMAIHTGESVIRTIDRRRQARLRKEQKERQAKERRDRENGVNER